MPNPFDTSPIKVSSILIDVVNSTPLPPLARSLISLTFFLWAIASFVVISLTNRALATFNNALRYSISAINLLVWLLL